MSKPVFKVAIFHHDAEIIGRVSRLAGGCGLEVVRARSLAALAGEMGDPLLSSVVVDLASPRDGGFEVLEPLCKPGTKAAIIVIGTLDGKTAEGTASLAASKGVEIAVFRKEDCDERSLARELCAGRDRAPRFGPKDLDDCIDNGHFRVEYQPKVPLLKRMELKDVVFVIPKAHLEEGKRYAAIAKVEYQGGSEEYAWDFFTGSRQHGLGSTVAPAPGAPTGPTTGK